MTRRPIHHPLLIAVGTLLAIAACKSESATPASVELPAGATEPGTPGEHAEHAGHAEHAEHADHAAHEHGEHHADHAAHMAHALPADAPLADRSIYHLDASFIDQRGNPVDFASLRGSAVLTTMFYSSCTAICPMLIEQVKRIDNALPPETRANTKVFLVSLDPARDTVEKLAELAKRHGIDDPRWSFVRTSDASVREVAAVLGVRYRSMPNGDISHSPLVALLDREGVLSTRMEEASGDPSALIAATTRVAQATTK